MKKQRLYQLFCSVFSFLFLFLILGVLFDNKTILEIAKTPLHVCAFLVVPLLFCILYFMIDKFVPDQLSVSKERWLYVCLGLLFLLIQVLVIYFLQTTPGWDWKIVYESTLAYVKGDMNQVSWSYFQSFPNNNALFLVQVLFFKFLKVIGCLKFSLPATYILNLCLVDCAAFLTIKTVRNFFGSKYAIFACFLVLCSSAFYLYLPIFYTDTLSISFPIATLYCYSRLYKDLTFRKENIHWWVMMGLFSAIGSFFKVTCVIVLIAIIIDFWFQKKWKEFYKPSLCVVSVFLVSYMILNLGMSCSGVFPKETLDKGKSLPYTHWIMMGLYEEPSFIKDKNWIGAYSLKAYQYTYSFPDKESKTRANIKKIKEILNDYKWKGYVKFLYRKALFTWGDGTYHGSAFVADKPLSKKNILQEFIFPDGEWFQLFYFKDTGLTFFYYIMFILGACAFVKTTKNTCNVGFITIFGIFVFFLLWEASAKYLMHYIPVFIVTSMTGIQTLSNIVHYRKNK